MVMIGASRFINWLMDLLINFYIILAKYQLMYGQFCAQQASSSTDNLPVIEIVLQSSGFPHQSHRGTPENINQKP